MKKGIRTVGVLVMVAVMTVHYALPAYAGSSSCRSFSDTDTVTHNIMGVPADLTITISGDACVKNGVVTLSDVEAELGTHWFSKVLQTGKIVLPHWEDQADSMNVKVTNKNGSEAYVKATGKVKFCFVPFNSLGSVGFSNCVSVNLKAILVYTASRSYMISEFTGS